MSAHLNDLWIEKSLPKRTVIYGSLLRYLRKRIPDGETDSEDLGPEEEELTLKDDEVESANRKELRRLTEALKEIQTAPRYNRDNGLETS